MPETVPAPSRPKRRRRRLFLFLIVLAVGATLLRVGLDRDRQTQWLIDQLHDRYGLTVTLAHPAQISIWPELSLRLTGVGASAIGATQTMIEAERVWLALPWKALFSATPTIGAVTLEAPRLNGPAIASWLEARAQLEAGPPAPPRWPMLEAPVRVRRASWGSGADLRLQNLDLDLAPLRAGAKLDLAVRAELVRAGLTQLVALKATGAVRDTDGGVALDALLCNVDVGAAGTAPVQYSFSGSAVYTSAAAWRFEGRILAAPVTAATDLVLALGRDAERGLALSTHGSLDGARIDGELTLPGDLPATTDLPAWITALNTRLRGSLSVPHLSFGGIEIEGLELHATDTAVSGIAPR